MRAVGIHPPRFGGEKTGFERKCIGFGGTYGDRLSEKKLS